MKERVLIFSGLIIMAIVFAGWGNNTAIKTDLPVGQAQQANKTNAQASGNVQNLTPFFFSDIAQEKQYVYQGTVWGREQGANQGEDVEVRANLTVSKIAELREGKVYELSFSLTDVKTNTEKKGYKCCLWVTGDRIYAFAPPDIQSYDVTRFTKNGYFDDAKYAKYLAETGELPGNEERLIYCGNDNMKLKDGAFEKEIKVANNTCTYTAFNPGNSSYAKYVWEAGNGLTVFSWGYGAHSYGMDLHLVK